MNPQPVHFHNRIFLCDIVGYSERSPVEQQECHALIVDLTRRTATHLGVRLGEDVIAVPTGDGVALNFRSGTPDIHLRSALEVLRLLAEHNARARRKVELRVGLNTHVDAIVRDVNGKENIVGTGINEAQRIMGLGSHAQVLMHRRVYHDLCNYRQYQGCFRDLGACPVKHRTMPVFQYVDPSCPQLNSEPPQQPARPAGRPALRLSDIRRRRITENLLRVDLSGGDRDSLAELRDYVADFLDERGAFQQVKLAVEWVAGELLDNVFRHARPAEGDRVVLTLDLTKRGILIGAEQPAVPGFDLSAILGDDRYRWHFLAMMHRRGFKLSARTEAGRTTVSCELPLDASVYSLDPETLEPPKPARPARPLPRPARRIGRAVRRRKGAAAAGAEGLFAERALPGGVLLVSLLAMPGDGDGRRVDSAIAEHFGKRPPRVILDLGAVGRKPPQSSQIAWLVGWRTTIDRAGGKLVLVNVPGEVVRILDLNGIVQLFAIAPDLDTALEHFRRTRRGREPAAD